MNKAHSIVLVSGLGIVGWLAPPPLVASTLVEGSVESELVPGPVEYTAVLPSGYESATEPLPLVLDLHGGGGSREVLERQQPLLDDLWAEGRVEAMVVVMPSVTPRGFYLDRRDGAERWESFLVGPFLEHVRSRFRVRRDRRGTMVTGISMGGMGALRLAFKYPDRFGAVAAMEPGIEPILEWDEMRPKHRFWRSDALMEQAYGDPIDEEYFASNNPATIVARQAERIRDSGLAIFLEAGDRDMFWLYEGAEFLHRTLWDHRVRHEYRLYLGADHVGASLGPRTQVAFVFLSETLRPPEADPRVEAARRRIDPLKAGLDEADHYGVDAHLIGSKD